MKLEGGEYGPRDLSEVRRTRIRGAQSPRERLGDHIPNFFNFYLHAFSHVTTRGFGVGARDDAAQCAPHPLQAAPDPAPHLAGRVGSAVPTRGLV